MIYAGELKHRILIEQEQRTSDGMGGDLTTWQPLGVCWAKMQSSTLKDRLYHGELQHTQMVYFTIRQKQKMFCINPQESATLRVAYRGDLYRVVNFEPVVSEDGQEYQDFYRLTCERYGGTASA